MIKKMTWNLSILGMKGFQKNTIFKNFLLKTSEIKNNFGG